ncbi:MAG: PilZ domain-containing protein [Desulfobacterales bacterium]|nr:MAG: PilZ domain-containing protein [Desulfobacterales bacterium]
MVDLISDRRDNKRYQYEAIIWHDNLLPGIFYAAKMCNLSKRGVYFESDQTLYPGEKIYIAKKIPSSNNDTKECVKVEIKWRKDIKGSSFQYGYGARFINSSSTIVKSVDKADFHKQKQLDNDLKYKKDPREYQREDYRLEVVFRSKSRRYKGFITNISRSGTFIETHDKFSLGQIIRLFIPGDKTHKEFKLIGWVVRLNKNGIGIKFDRRSSRERRKDLDRRSGMDRRGRARPK